MAAMTDLIVVADDDPYIQQALGDRLESLGYRVLKANDGESALDMVERQDPQLMFLDIEMPRMKGLDVLREIRQRGKDLPVIMITAYGSIDLAVEAMKAGAYDFIPKPFKAGHIALVLEKAIERQRLHREKKVLSEEIEKRYHLVAGTSTTLKHAIATAKKAATSRSTILLLGESGTGKEVFARAIHNWSERNERPFIAINCVGLSRELLESELFGYEKGAFTGAGQLKRGKIELANGGSIFLDEIGDISGELQTKLLRFLQEREFERVGGTQLIHVDVRIIAATNRNLEAAVKEGRFREDLYYRINVVPIVLPPLREHKDDIPSLVQFFIQRFSHECEKKFTGISQEALEALLSYDWPGNVRELANVIERAVVLGEPPTIHVENLSPVIQAAEAEVNGASAATSYHECVEEYRREIIVRALAQSQGNRSAAARILGLERSYLLKLMKSLGIS